MSPESIREMTRQINALDWDAMTHEQIVDCQNALDALARAALGRACEADTVLGEFLDAETYRIPEECEREPEALTIDGTAAVLGSWSDPVTAAAAFGEAF